MNDRKCGGLLRKGEREFPNQDNGCIYENRKCSVLKFAGEIVADPRVGTEQRKMAFTPTSRNVREHRQNRQFIIVIPKNQRIVPEQQQTKETDDYSDN